VGTFRRVRAIELLVAAGALVVALGAIGALAAARRRVLPADAARVAEAIPAALGDAVLLVDARGLVTGASDAARRLWGDELTGRALASLGPDLAVLARGLARGPASSLVTLSLPAGAVRARAALLRVGTRRPVDVVVLRPEPAPRPPPLPAPGPAVAASLDAAHVRAAVASAAAALREPLAAAGRAASLLRLSAPPLPARAEGALAALEAAVADGERRLAAVEAAGQAGVRRTVDVAALVGEVATSCAPPGVRVRVDAEEPAPARIDDRALRAAVREVLRASAEHLGAGAEIAVAVRARAAGPLLEISSDAARPPGAAALARALLAPQGARVEEDGARGRGWTLRIALPPAGAALAPA
jgi:hypothetical protein